MTPEVLQASIEGVMKEIARKDSIVRQMRHWYLHPESSVFTNKSYTVGYIMKEGPKLLKDIAKLKQIKIELVYLYELSKLKEA